MKTWTITGVLLVAGAMLAGPAVAQAPPSSTDQKDKAKGGAGTESGAGKTDTMKSDTGAAKSAGGGRMAAGREHVKTAQQALKDKGHDPGAVDGVMGPKTQAALKDFQSKEGLKASGQLDAETMSKLGVAADTGSGSPSALPRAGGSTTTK